MANVKSVTFSVLWEELGSPAALKETSVDFVENLFKSVLPTSSQEIKDSLLLFMAWVQGTLL